MDASFSAVPAQGYRFIRWRGVCSKSKTDVCDLTLLPLPGQLAHFSGDIDLSAEFESADTVRPWFRDSDDDHYGSPIESIVASIRPDGFVVDNTDCDDQNRKVYPRAKERNDNVDNNCNGVIDEGFVNTLFFLDDDGDGYGNKDLSKTAHRLPKGYADNDLDCNDLDADSHPQAEELADGRDNNCDGQVDEGGGEYFIDSDGDGFGSAEISVFSFKQPEGYVANHGDCDDGNSTISPVEEELFDSADNDCDGLIDEGFTVRTYYRDVDGDSYGDPSDVVHAPEQPEGYVETGFDNCPTIFNPDQSDTDSDGIGDACDEVNDAPAAVVFTCSASVEQQQMLAAVNAFRSQPQKCGASGSFSAAPALSWSCSLEEAALYHSADMANNGFFSHTGTGGTSFADRAVSAGYSWSALGENIAAGGALSSVDAALQGWINSPPHCANLMAASFVHLGAAKYSGTNGVYWTQMFGRPR